MNLEDLNINPGTKVATISMITPKLPGHETEKETQDSLRELRELCRTLGLEHLGEFVQNKKEIEPATFLGSGRLGDIAEECERLGVEILIFDFELTASQMRNIKKITDISVMDRVNVILEIFARHARTRDAKIQIEISRLEYLLPRLSSLWTHFTRQKGGIGLKGEGEQQLELDRRLVRSRIQLLKKQLVTLEKSRKEQRKKRHKKAITAALVGYTNAGKSSLMNRLCRAGVLEEDKLFATLDSTFRMLNPDTKPPMLLIDIVGFIQNLPNTLINGFKTTLESALEADLIITVCDISDENFEKHLEVTKDVLKELGISDKENLVVFNKKDLNDNFLRAKLALKKFPHSYLVSALDDDDVTHLRGEIIDYFLSKQEMYELFIPYEDGGAHSAISGGSNIMSTQNHEEGIFYRIRTPDFIFHSLGIEHYLTGPEFLNQKKDRF